MLILPARAGSYPREDLELAVIDYDGPHALVFSCRRVLGGWVNAKTRERLDVRPTHWRPWGQSLVTSLPHRCAV